MDLSGCAVTAGMAIAPLIIQHFTYGFVATLFVKDVGYPAYFWAVAWFLITQLAWHFQDTFSARIDFLVYPTLNFLFGAIAAICFSSWARFPRLFNSRVMKTGREAFAEPYDKRSIRPEPALWWFASILVFASVALFVGAFSRPGCAIMSSTDATVTAVVFVVVAAIIVIGLITWACTGSVLGNGTDVYIYRYESRKLIKYFATLLLLMGVPSAVNDFVFMSGETFWFGLWAAFSAFLLWIAFYFANAYIPVVDKVTYDAIMEKIVQNITNPERKERTKAQLAHDGFGSASRERLFYGIAGTFHVLTIIVEWLVVVYVGTSLAAFFSVLGMVILFIIFLAIIRWATDLFELGDNKLNQPSKNPTYLELKTPARNTRIQNNSNAHSAMMRGRVGVTRV